MSCALTQGYNVDCRDSVGGIKELYISELDNITGTTGSASGNITAVTMTTGSQFRKYQLDANMNPADWDEQIQANSQNGSLFYEQSLNLKLRKMQATLRNEIRLLAQNRLAVIVLDRNGKYWLLGLNNGLEIQPSKSGSGSGMGDFNGYQLVFKGMEELPACEVTGTLIDALLQPAS